MDAKKIEIRPELSAQGIRKKPNPLLLKLIPYLKKEGIIPKGKIKLVDQGCGQLRHTSILKNFADPLIAVDTNRQIETEHDFYGKKYKIGEFVKKKWPTDNIEVLTATQFASQKKNAALIISVNVIDVLPKGERKKLFSAAYDNLRNDGYYLVIIPRNDTWTLRICTPRNKFEDGYIFMHSKGYTFYKNWEVEDIAKELRYEGFGVVKDISQYKYICLLLQKAKSK
jgi:hypothetical protein